jgi:uncharacterized protein involved in exopolysaccharide biosynthesis
VTGPLTEPESVPAGQLLGDWLAAALGAVTRTGFLGIVWTLLGAGAGVAIALLLPPYYTASASFIAQGSSASMLPGALQGLAASVGLASAKDYSPQFYADLFQSQPVISAVLGRRYAVPASPRTDLRTYYEIEDIAGRDSATRLDNASRHLRRRIAARADVRTNIITVSVTARYPELSRDLTRVMLEALDSMNVSFRQEQSRELREFFETRVSDAQRALDSAETVLRQFLERNRAIQNSPLLTFEQMRLTRGADLKRTVYTTVLQQFEEARIQEARNVPVLTVLTPPAAPIRKAGPPRRLIVATAMLLGLLLAVVHERIRAIRTDPTRAR